MTLSRRELIRTLGGGLASVSAAAEFLACSSASQTTVGNSEPLLVSRPGQPAPAPVGYDRLSLAWYKAAALRLKQKAKALGVDAILLHR